MPRPPLRPAPAPVIELLAIVASAAADPIHKSVLRDECAGRTAEDWVRRATADVAHALAACPPTPQQRQTVRLRLTRALEALTAATRDYEATTAARDALNAAAYRKALAILPQVDAALRYAYGHAARSALQSGSPLPEQWLALQTIRQHYRTCLDALGSITPADAPPVTPSEYLTLSFDPDRQEAQS